LGGGGEKKQGERRDLHMLLVLQASTKIKFAQTTKRIPGGFGTKEARKRTSQIEGKKECALPVPDSLSPYNPARRETRGSGPKKR